MLITSPVRSFFFLLFRADFDEDENIEFTIEGCVVVSLFH